MAKKSRRLRRRRWTGAKDYDWPWPATFSFSAGVANCRETNSFVETPVEDVAVSESHAQAHDARLPYRFTGNTDLCVFTWKKVDTKRVPNTESETRPSVTSSNRFLSRPPVEWGTKMAGQHPGRWRNWVRLTTGQEFLTS